MYAYVSSKERGKRDQRWYLSSLCISITCTPHLPPSLASLIPLFPGLSQENYNLTAHFNISASKWVWQALLCVPPPSSVPTSIYPPTPLSLSPCPNLLVSFAHRFPRRFNFYHVTAERGRGKETGKKTKTNQAQTEAALPGYQAVSLWVLWHVHDHEPTMRRGITLPWCTPLTLRFRLTQAVFQSDRQGSDLIHRDRHWLRIEVYVCEQSVYGPL